jgi:hypothetical protein
VRRENDDVITQYYVRTHQHVTAYDDVIAFVVLGDVIVLDEAISRDILLYSCYYSRTASRISVTLVPFLTAICQ